jgi:alanine dehydrogenase
LLRIGVPREIKPGENRVGLTPAGASVLRDIGAQTFVEAGAGAESGFDDGEYLRAGARIVPDAGDAWTADLVVKVKEPLPEEFRHLSASSALFTFLHLAAFPELTAELVARRVTAIAYETVTSGGGLPILRPMSEVAGVLSIQAGARGLEKGCGGRGVLLPGAGGSPPGDVCILGAGVAGRAAARIATGIGANVTALDVNREKLALVERESSGRVRTALSNPEAIVSAARESDLLVSTVLVPGERAPVLVNRELLRTMRPGAVAVDVAVDQGGSLETTHPTTHADPYYTEEGVVHYCVANMPAAVPRTSTQALTAVTLMYLQSFARNGVEGALRRDPGLLAGLNTFRGSVSCRGVAKAFGMPFVPPLEALGR